jgi:hypothetical protein
LKLNLKETIKPKNKTFYKTSPSMQPKEITKQVPDSDS